MSSFAYVARETGSGREIRSSVDANTEQAAIAALLNRNLLVVSIQEKVGKKGRTGGGKVGLADLVIFTRQLATMIDAGLAMVQSLQALAEQTTNKVMRDVIKDVCTRVEGGDSFSEALQKHPKAFSRLYVCMVAAEKRAAAGGDWPAGGNPRWPRGCEKGHAMIPDGCDRRGHPYHSIPVGQSGARFWRDFPKFLCQTAGSDPIFD
jgi:hypothetical protein